MTSTSLCKQALPRRPAPQGLTSRDAWVLVNGGKVETLHLTVGPHPLALGLEAEATLGLFFAADANVTECGTHGASSLRWAVRIPPGGTLASAAGKKEDARQRSRPARTGRSMAHSSSVACWAPGLQRKSSAVSYRAGSILCRSRQHRRRLAVPTNASPL